MIFKRKISDISPSRVTNIAGGHMYDLFGYDIIGSAFNYDKYLRTIINGYFTSCVKNNITLFKPKTVVYFNDI